MIFFLNLKKIDVQEVGKEKTSKPWHCESVWLDGRNVFVCNECFQATY